MPAVREFHPYTSLPLRIRCGEKAAKFRTREDWEFFRIRVRAKTKMRETTMIMIAAIAFKLESYTCDLNTAALFLHCIACVCLSSPVKFHLSLFISRSRKMASFQGISLKLCSLHQSLLLGERQADVKIRSL